MRSFVTAPRTSQKGRPPFAIQGVNPDELRGCGPTDVALARRHVCARPHTLTHFRSTMSQGQNLDQILIRSIPIAKNQLLDVGPQSG
eukprot:m.13645 g.13645  ORF g.13645 m.13645 type:complete len:87 (+) comp8191_c0_seq1:1232-1492(+)